ncbi:hypothetical protein MTR67_044406 [Solanum verrucosum]|uniref:Uncharacterized protein n=1 Tax=Solanum verrucosum TaxID=315347 RepID=A0AAF0UTB1_SOLVR|nr:hypothetical protein MTR67_044406 [Solanum verrucosum]
MEHQFSTISTDKIFYNSQIRSTFTISTEIHYYTTPNSIVIWRRFQTQPKSIRVSLRKLFMDDCETASWSSSSEANDLKGIPSRTYCLWRPILMEESPS